LFRCVCERLARKTTAGTLCAVRFDYTTRLDALECLVKNASGTGENHWRFAARMVKAVTSAVC
jgi:hypothetical protein